MTKKRNDNHSTEFGLWLREQPNIDSQLGFLATNLDYVWTNYNSGKWMLIEEKRYMSRCKPWQRNLFNTVHKSINKDSLYKGFHLLQFEKTSPEDGKIYINCHEVTKDQLVLFLKFDDEVLNYVWRSP